MNDEPGIDLTDPNETFTCWCGATGTYDDLFCTDDCDETCGGTGTLNCYCGGDQCVCHHHGSTECPGCEDCDDSDDSFAYDPEDDL